MSRILLQTTIAENGDDWSIARFSLLADELRAAGHHVTARNRATGADDDPILSRLDELDHDQLWLMAVDVGDGLTAADSAAIVRFRENGGGVLTARDHQDLGSCLLGLGTLGEVNHFHEKNPDPSKMRDDQDTPTISWPNYHSGANGDYQPVFADAPTHELLRTTATAGGRIEWFPAHPHEGGVSACVPSAAVLAQGRSTASWPPVQPRRGAGRRARTGWQAHGSSSLPNRPSTTSPITTGTSTAVRRRSSPNLPGRKSRATQRLWRSSRTTCATSPTGCIPPRAAVHRSPSPRREPRDSPEAVNRPPLDGVLTREQRKRERILAVDMKLEVVVLPVSDVDRARQFYEALGWRLDADFSTDAEFRVVQLTHPVRPRRSSSAPASPRRRRARSRAFISS